MTVKGKTKAVKAKSKDKKTARAEKTPPAAKLGKPVMRTTAAKTAAAANGSVGGRPKSGLCVCGCGELSTNNLRRGHFKRVIAKLRQIKNGETTPDRAFGKKLAAAYGPWKTLKSGGMTPATTDYDKVRLAFQ